MERTGKATSTRWRPLSLKLTRSFLRSETRSRRAVKDGTISFAQFSKQMTELNRDQMRDGLDNVMSSMVATAEQKKAALQKALNEGAISYQQYGNSVRDVERQNQQNMLDTASRSDDADDDVQGEQSGGHRRGRDQYGRRHHARSAICQPLSHGYSPGSLLQPEPRRLRRFPAQARTAGAEQQRHHLEMPEPQHRRPVRRRQAKPFSHQASARPSSCGEMLWRLAKELVKYQRDGGTVVFQGRDA